MIQFETREIWHGPVMLEASCLVTPIAKLENNTETIQRDGEEIDLPNAVVGAMVKAITACDFMDRRGYGVDCTVFGTLMAGGSYKPVEDHIYKNRLRHSIGFGRWLSEEEIFGSTEVSELVQFINYDHGSIFPRHTAVKLPDNPDLYIQKVGHSLPFALMDATSNCRFHGANSIATVDELSVTFDAASVINYTNPTPHSELPSLSYLGLPNE